MPPLPEKKEAPLAGGAPLKTLTSPEISSVENTCQDPILPDVIDPGLYRATVSSLPRVFQGRFIEVIFHISEPEGGTVYSQFRECFDIKAPCKLLKFLAAIGQPSSETALFEISPHKWWTKECDVELAHHFWKTEDGQVKERNTVKEYISCT